MGLSSRARVWKIFLPTTATGTGILMGLHFAGESGSRIPNSRWGFTHCHRPTPFVLFTGKWQVAVMEWSQAKPRTKRKSARFYPIN
jgi:hypothetical protein